MNPSDVRIAIMTPSVRQPSWDYIKSVETLEAYVLSHGVLGSRIGYMERMLKTQCSNLPQGRQDMLDDAVSEGFTHGVMIDDDMGFPPDILDIMLPRNVQCLGVNALRKDPLKASYTATALDGSILESYGKSGYEVVRDCGLGFMVLDLSIFSGVAVDLVDCLRFSGFTAAPMRSVPRPHFEILYDTAFGGYCGEDRYFTRKLSQYGVAVFIDHDASHYITHIGDFPYGYESMAHKLSLPMKDLADGDI